jgi:hypothetical protein
MNIFRAGREWLLSDFKLPAAAAGSAGLRLHEVRSPGQLAAQDNFDQSPSSLDIPPRTVKCQWTDGWAHGTLRR